MAVSGWGLGLRVAAWAERGKPLQNPGPLLRVRAGTPVRVTLRNTLERALVVYGFGAARAGRVFLMSWWYTIDSTSPTGLGRATMAINGLSWPHTERIDLVQGDSVRWRVINLTGLDHPMHLHGFYFQVRAKGNGVRDTVYAEAERRLAVTEIVFPNQTVTFAWQAMRPGNWIYHCHFSGHISDVVSLDVRAGARHSRRPARPAGG